MTKSRKNRTPTKTKPFTMTLRKSTRANPESSTKNKDEDTTLPQDLIDRIPQEVIEMVLHHVPIPDLCRFRLVSPKWDDSITQPSFAAKTNPQTTYHIRSLHTLSPWTDSSTTPPHRAWEIFDTTTKKPYALPDTFLYNHVRQKLPHEPVLQRCTIAAHRGFLCILIRTPPDSITGPSSTEALFVVNPVTASFKELDPPLCGMRGNPSVTMVVADDMASFQIFVVQEANLISGEPDQQRCYIFESSAGAWRPMAQPPATMTPCHVLRVGMLLYHILVDLGHRGRVGRTKLFSYDIVGGLWSELLVELIDEVFIPQLVVCLGRVFFIAFRDDLGLSVWEVDLGGGELRFVAELDRAVVDRITPDFMSRFGGSYWTPCCAHVGNNANVVVFGSELDGCIVVSSIVGKAVGFCLLTNSWVNWFGHNLAIDYSELFDLKEVDVCGMFGSCMALNLSSVP